MYGELKTNACMSANMERAVPAEPDLQRAADRLRASIRQAETVGEHLASFLERYGRPMQPSVVATGAPPAAPGAYDTIQSLLDTLGHRLDFVNDASLRLSEIA